MDRLTAFSFTGATIHRHMANFLPLKHYMWYCLDHMIKRYHLRPPFLDIGCGIGDVSKYMALRQWEGTAIDFSERAVERAGKNLAAFPQVNVMHTSLDRVHGTYHTIFLWDVLEHIEQDAEALATIAALLHPDGHLIIAVPSNPREWRWDDDFYGHYRRYTTDDMTRKLTHAGLMPLVMWDFTFPFFWALRRAYTWLKSPPRGTFNDKECNTKASATINAWDLPLISRILNHTSCVWRIIYPFQFALFKSRVARGHEMFVIAKKMNSHS